MNVTMLPMPDTNQLYASALWHADQGMPVFPLTWIVNKACSCNDPLCRSQGKHPLISEWPVNASTEPDQIKKWWALWPFANIGVVCGIRSGISVLDVDFRHGGADGLDAFKNQYGDFDTPMVIAGDGFHYYFKNKPGLRNNVSIYGPGLDVRNDGGYVCGAGSWHLSGKQYMWEASSEFSRDALAEFPGAVPEARVYQNETIDSALGVIYGEGTRNVMMMALAGALRNKNEDEDDIVAALVRSNAKRCRPPLSYNELGTIAKSVMRYAPGSAPVWVRPALVAHQSKNASSFWLDEAEISVNPDYFVKGILERGSSSMIYGKSGDGKTFFTIDMLCKIAAGQPWRDRRVKSTLIVYVASEAGSSIARRFVAWRETNLGEARDSLTPLAVITKGPNLMKTEDVLDLEREIDRLSKHAGIPVGIIAFDTLSRSAAGADENSAKDIGSIIGAGDYLRDKMGAAVLYVHHSGKDVTKGARGSSALHAACDTVIRVENKVATIEKSRDGLTGQDYPFDLKMVVLGVDSDGDEISTCLVTEVTTGHKKSQKLRLTGNDLIVMNALRTAISDFGVVSPGTSVLPAGVKFVEFDRFKSVVTGKLPPDEIKRVNQKINRSLERLLAQEYLKIEGKFMFLWV